MLRIILEIESYHYRGVHQESIIHKEEYQYL